MRADREEIIADGADLNRVHLRLVDENGTAPVTAEDRVEFSLEGAGQLVGENPTHMRAGEVIILARSGFAPGPVRVTAKVPDRADIEDVSVEFTTVAPPARVDMPQTEVPLPTQMAVVAGLKTNITERVAEEDAAEALTIPKLRKVEPGTMAVTEPLMVPGFDSVMDLRVEGAEYRIYSSPWTSEPGKIMSGDAVRFRMKAPAQPGAEGSAKVFVDGQEKTFTVQTAKESLKE
jgi:hypothetical protein